MAARGRTGTGRKKIEIRRIESEEARHVCFSKRRKGVFNKATELAIMCGAELAVLAVSPGGKAFTYGHPSFEYVLDRFSTSESLEAQTLAAVGAGAGDRNQALEELNQEHDKLRARLEAQKARKKAAEEAWAKARAEGFQAAGWLDAYVCQMGEDDLVAFAAALEMMHTAVAAHADLVRQVQEALLTLHGGGGGFEIGGTSGGMETMQQQQMMMVPMPPMPPAPGFATGMEMMPPGFGPLGFPL